MVFLVRKSRCNTGVSQPKFSTSSRKVKDVGRGVSGYVELFETKGEERYIVKTYYGKEKYEKSVEYKRRVLHEYEALKRLEHENVIRVFKYEYVRHRKVIQVFMEAGSRDLYRVLSRAGESGVSPDETLCFWKQVCNGVRYLHENARLCHRDLKLSNVVLDSQLGLVKIIDFATAFFFDDVAGGSQAELRAIGLVGTEGYLSPETYLHLFYDGKKADIWSLGIMWYYLANHSLPWKAAHHNDPDFRAFSDTFNEETRRQRVLQFLPEDSQPLLLRVYSIDPSLRPSIADFFADPWFSRAPFCSRSSRCCCDHSKLIARYC